MSNSINLSVQISSNVHGCEVYAFAMGNVSYNLKDEANIDAMREFVITNKGRAGYTGITQLISNVSALEEHSGEGQEEFKGTLTKSFDDLQSGDQNITIQDEYTNYTYAAIQDGLNRSLWTITPAANPSVFYMFLVKTISGGRFGTNQSNQPHFSKGQSYVQTSDGTTHNFSSSVITNHVMMSSTRDSGFNSGIMVTASNGSTSGYIGEYFIFRVNSDSDITAFHMETWGSWPIGTMTYEIRKYEGNKLAEFDQALLNDGNYLAINTKATAQTGYQELLTKFGDALVDASASQGRFTYTIPR